MLSTTSPRRRGRPVQTRGFPRVNVRLPPDLYDQVLAAAKDYLSINSEIIRRLRIAYSASAKKQSGRRASALAGPAAKKSPTNAY
jgi:hypothetical protein